MPESAASTAPWPRTVAHADMDAFYAAVEQMDDPSLRGRPILIGSPSNRGVVLTASYEARPYGVGSAMPMARARKLCPDALIVRPNFARYREISASVMRVFADFSPDVEAISLDEAFLEMTGAERIFGPPEVMGRKLKDAVREATGGLTVTVGISGTKYVAKVASGYRKPDGLTIVPPDEAQAWLAPLPVSRLWGVGVKTEPRLLRLGLKTIGDVASADPKRLERELGRAGAHYYALAHAQDPRRVAGTRSSKSIGSEVTLSRDIPIGDEMKRHLRRAAEEIGRRLRRKHYVAFGVRVKLKTADFQLLTRQHRLTRATDVADEFHRIGVSLLDEFNHRGPFRLVGMAAYDIERDAEKDQTDLFAAGGERRRKLEVAMDSLSEKFGAGVVRNAADLRSGPRGGHNLDFLDDMDEEEQDDRGNEEF
jgi:DNA polymerase IV